MDSIEWEDDLMDLNLGCQNIFDDISLDFLDVTEALSADYYEPKSKNVIERTVPP